LNQQEGAGKYRLPTEAEWEYAARAGTTSTYSFGDDTEALWRYAWYSGNSIPPCPESLNNCLNFLEANAHPVGQKKPNAWGLYDMHGNVLEWVQDWYGEKYYSGSSGTDPQGPSSGSYRVGRGGRWDGSVRDCRSAYRDGGTPDSRYNFLGFRLAFSPGQ
jgi:formylglycine-generating enzyme required for sulfatase activity